MKFFKHFTDAHQGRSMQALMNKFGLEGYAAFFILTEICASKLEKEPNQKFTEEHLKFTFNERIVREKLRMRSTKVELFLNYCSTLDLLQFTKDQDEINFYFPKLLESLDRDTKRARTVRATAAPKIKKKIKKKIVEVEETQTAQTAAPISSEKKKREIIKIKNAQELVNTFSEEFLAQLRETYGDHFVGQEIPQMALKIIATEDYKTNYQSFAQAWMRYSSKHAEREEAQMRKASNVNNVMAMVGNG